MQTFGADLMARLSAMTPSGWCAAAGVAILALAIAWIGRNVSRLIASHESVRQRVHQLWARQDRLQSIVEERRSVAPPSSRSKPPRDWRDSSLLTQERPSGELDLTHIEFKPPR